MISFFDLIISLIIFGFFWFGFWYGLIYSVGTIFGMMAGAFGASHYYLQVAGMFSSEPSNFLKVIVFILLFGVINKIIGLAFWIIDKIFNLLSIIPFLKTINRLAGGALGLLEGVLTLGLMIYIYSKYPFSDWINAQLPISYIAPKLLVVMEVLKPFFPDALEKLKTFI
jgi:uncharacterized membrane protein required for colicin V production